MGSGRSIQLFRIAGIRIGATLDWFLVLFVLIYLLSGRFDDVVATTSTGAFGLAVAGALLFEVSIVAHEIGHALTARQFGVNTEGIDLWFFGGVARLDREADTPFREAAIAFAGPLATAGVVGVCALAGTLAADWQTFLDSALLRDTDLSAFEALVGYLATVNAFLFVFNMLPAYPLDGGRLAKAAAWKATGNRSRGLAMAGRLGLLFSYALVALGIVVAVTSDPFNGVWLAIVGYSMASGAKGAVAVGGLQERIDGVTVASIMADAPATIPSQTTMLAATETFFAGDHWPWYAVADEDGTYRGILLASRAHEEVAAGRPALTASEVLGRDAADEAKIAATTPIEALLGSEPLRAYGALLVVDDADVLKGVITVEQVNRALVG